MYIKTARDQLTLPLMAAMKFCMFRNMPRRGRYKHKHWLERPRPAPVPVEPYVCTVQWCADQLLQDKKLIFHCLFLETAFSHQLRYISVYIVYICCMFVFCCVSHASGMLKELNFLQPVPLINVSSKTVDQSEDPGSGANIASFCLQ